jgi:serine phosphatase RsbU (regulator of sigma subunit)
LQQQEEILTQRDELEKNFELIESKNQHITASITYAQRIQAAMLTDTQNLQKLLPNSFILFKPRDIVSGDFYWFRKGKNTDGEIKIMLAAVDCTGHGVPGAFMSMIGSNLLNQILANGTTSPELVLQELHQGITLALHQDNGENKDGMDMVFCTIDHQKQMMEVAGAKNPILYIQNGELHEIKGDRHPIGGKDKDDNARIFAKHTIAISQPTYLYLFTDGYQDQFGGKDNRKFMIKRMREMFLANYREPMPKQEIIFNQIIEDWKNGQHQIDDILLIGCAINT